jgi:hypothetical protein
MQVYRTRLENGYEPEWRLLYGDTPAEALCGEEFLQLCEEIVCPIWSAANEA